MSTSSNPPPEATAQTASNENAVTDSQSNAPAPETDDQSQDPAKQKAQADKLIAEGKKAIALKQWDEGVARYADALDIMRQLVGEFDPKMAPLLLSYGKALYELAFSQQGVMGKEEVEKTADQARAAAEDSEPSSSKFTFAEPAFEDDVEGDEEGGAGANGEGGAQDDAAGPAGEGEGGEGSARPETENAGEQGGDEEEAFDELEDDYNAAWEVLDVARTIYSKMVDEAAEGEKKEVQLNLAECYLALGDVSCETENFPQAVQDYTSALSLKSTLLPPSSRALASVHYQLATALEFTPNRRTDALSHVEKALQAFQLLKAELASGDESKYTEAVKKLSVKDRENELKDVEGLIEDLEVKIEELKAAPPAGDLVSESINHLLGGDAGPSSFGNGSGSSLNAGAKDDAPVNNLNSMVRKKAPKKQPVAAGATNGAAASSDGEGKRKAEIEAETADKKARVE